MPMVKPEWVKAIKGAIQVAYDADEIQTFGDFKKVFLKEWDSLGVDDNHLRGAVLTSVYANNAVVVALRQKAAEANRPITSDSPIIHLPLSTRVCNCLLRAGFSKVGDIALLKKDGDSIARKNVGLASTEEIYNALEWAGIEISEPLDFSGEEGSEKSGGVARVKPEKKPVEAVSSQRRIYLEAGEIFKTEFFSKNTKEIIIVFSDLESLGIKARRIVIEAEG